MVAGFTSSSNATSFTVKKSCVSKKIPPAGSARFWLTESRGDNRIDLSLKSIIDSILPGANHSRLFLYPRYGDNIFRVLFLVKYKMHIYYCKIERYQFFSNLVILALSSSFSWHYVPLALVWGI